jgi:hypothetical protein
MTSSSVVVDCGAAAPCVAAGFRSKMGVKGGSMQRSSSDAHCDGVSARDEPGVAPTAATQRS